MPRTPGSKNLDDAQRAEIERRAREGEEYTVIARDLRLHKSTVANHARRLFGYRHYPREPLKNGG